MHLKLPSQNVEILSLATKSDKVESQPQLKIQKKTRVKSYDFCEKK